MTNLIEKRLADSGIVLPKPPAPVAAYVPYCLIDNVVYVSGQVPLDDGKIVAGKLGADFTVEEGAAAAKLCAINLLAQLKEACSGDLNRLDRVVKLTGFVNCTPEFGDQPAVINGASEFLGQILGEAGAHARSAIGVSALPFGAAVEIEGVFSIR